MKTITTLTNSELRQYSGGGPISDWVACRVRRFIDHLMEPKSFAHFEYCGNGNNVRC